MYNKLKWFAFIFSKEDYTMYYEYAFLRHFWYRSLGQGKG